MPCRLSQCFTVLCSYQPLLSSFPAYGDMMRKIGAWTTPRQVLGAVALLRHDGRAGRDWRFPTFEGLASSTELLSHCLCLCVFPFSFRTDAFNTKFLDGLHENLRGLFSGVGSELSKDPFALLPAGGEAASSGDDASAGGGPAFEEVLSGTGLLYFSRWLSEHSPADVPLLLFWLDVQEYSCLPPAHAALDFRLRHACRLYDLYLRQGGHEHVAVVPAHVVREVLAALESPSPMIFNRAQQVVEAHLRDELYAHFLSSELCAKMKATEAALPGGEKGAAVQAEEVRHEGGKGCWCSRLAHESWLVWRPRSRLTLRSMILLCVLVPLSLRRVARAV